MNSLPLWLVYSALLSLYLTPSPLLPFSRSKTLYRSASPYLISALSTTVVIHLQLTSHPPETRYIFCTMPRNDHEHRLGNVNKVKVTKNFILFLSILFPIPFHFSHVHLFFTRSHLSLAVRFHFKPSSDKRMSTYHSYFGMDSLARAFPPPYLPLYPSILSRPLTDQSEPYSYTHRSRE